MSVCDACMDGVYGVWLFNDYLGLNDPGYSVEDMCVQMGGDVEDHDCWAKVQTLTQEGLMLHCACACH
jgi:hypothetical protein